ncbi:hypothetical protein B7494_g2370 [Chlorociboria aeruginascens]|nr:hypothetical protein B7494_g2370 [Chlorociboria aeruginascens]
MAGTIYEYSALPEGYFRLLTIVSVDNEKITCEIENFLFDKAPEYTALSYAWGNPLASDMIICDGKSLAITPHLHGAFQHLYALDPITKVWIDAVCINQADHIEKAVQTRRMNNVYRLAQKVLVWLGKGDDNGDSAMDGIEGINQKLALILQNNTPENIAFIDNWLGKGTLSSTHLPETNDSIWHALGHIYSRAWFTRLWVLQEVVLAKQIVVAYGKRRVEWNALTTLATGLRRANLVGLIGGTPSVSSNIKRAFLSIGLFSVAKNMVEANSASLLGFVRLARDKDVTQPVDRIYGLLGLVNPTIASQIVVDYSDEAKEKWWRVYIQYGKLQLQSETTLTLLSMAASQQRPIELPSWCPNFNSPPKDPFCLGGVIGYQAGFESWEDRLKPNVQILDSNNIKVSGFRVDHVHLVVGSPKHYFETEPSYGPSGSSALLLDYESRCLKVSQDTYNSPNKVPEAHWRTLTADADFHSRSPLPPNVLEDYLRVKQLWKSRRDQTSPNPIDSTPVSERQANLNYHQNWEAKRTRTFFSTEGGRVGLGPCDLKAGDAICVLYGGAPLFVLRFNCSSKEAQLVGDAFVYGLMDLKSIPASDRETEWFTIG